MKLKIIILSLVAAACALAQPVPYPNFSSGSSAPDVGKCGDQVNIASVYVRTQDPANGFSGPYFCLQTGASSLGAGAYGWKAMATQSSSPTTGTISVANGKAAVINNSLTFAGTDATTMTFPGTSDTVVTLVATQTLTAKTLTAPVIATISNTGTLTLPTTTAGIPVALFCGATSGSSVCANTSGGATARVFGGLATLASNSAVISSISPAFTSTSTFACTSNDQTTIGNPTKVLNTSSSSITISDTTGASDVVAYTCVGY